MEKILQFTLTLGETLDAVEEYLRASTGVLNASDTRAGCEFVKPSDGHPNSAMVKMSFRSK